MAVITLDWRETGSVGVRRTFNSIFRDAQQTQRQVDQLGRSLQGLGSRGVQVNTGDSTRRITALSNRAQELRQRLRDVSGQPVRVQVQSSGFREFSQSVGNTGQQLTAVQQRLIQYQQANAQLANSLSLPISSVRQLNVALSTLPGQTANVAARYTELRSAGESSVNAFRQLNTEFGLSRQQFDSLQASIGLSTQSLTALSLASGAVATAIGSIFQGGASNFLDLERSLQGAAIRAGESREGFGSVADEVRRLGAETRFTAPQVAAVTDQLSRIGFTANEQEQALDGLIRTALSSGESIGTVTQVVATALRQFNLGTEQTAQVGDLLSTAANRSNVSVGSLGQALRFVAPQARQLGVSLNDTVLALSLLGDNALQGGIGGRNLARALEVLNQASAATNSELAELSNGNEKAAGALQRLGTVTRDAEGNFLPLFDVLGQIQQELAGLENQADRDILLSALGGGTQGGRALNTLISTLNDAPKSVSRLRNELENAEATAARASEEFQRGLPGAVTQIQSAFEGLQIRFFEEFQDEAEAIVRAATGLIRTFLGLPQPIQSALIATTALTGVLSAAVAVIAGYQIAVRTLGVANVSLSASTIRAQAAQSAATAATVANTVAARSNAIAQINVATALNGIAAASGRAVAGLGAQTTALRASAAVSARGFAATLSGLQLNVQTLGQLRSAVIGNPFFQAGVYAGVAAAVIAVADTFNEVTESAGETRERIQGIQDALGDVARARQAAAQSGSGQEDSAIEEELAQNAELAADRLSLLQRVLDQIRGPIRSVEGNIDALVEGLIRLLPLPDGVRRGLLSLINLFPQQATAAEAAANRQAVAFGDLISQTDDLIDSVNQGISSGADASILEAQLTALQNNVSALEAERPVTEDAIRIRNVYLDILKETEQQLRSNIDEQQSNASAVGQASDQISAAVNNQAAAFDNLLRSTQNSLSATDGDELATRANLEEEKARLILNGSSVDAVEEVNQRIFDSEQAFNESRIQQLEIAKRRIDELSALDPRSASNNADEIESIDTELRELRIENAQAISENAEEQEERRLQAVRRSFDQQAALIEANSQERARALIALEQELTLSGTPEQVIRATVELAGIEDARTQLNEQIALEQRRRDQFEEGTEDRASAIAQIDRLQTDLDRNELEAIRARRQQEQSAEDARIEAIRREGQEAERSLDIQAQAQELFFNQQQRNAKESARIFDLATDSLDNQNSALERRGQLLSAQNSLQDALDSGEVQGLERALAIRRQLNSDEELSANARRGLERELSAITGSRSTSERRIQQELLQAEQQRSQNRLLALDAQQSVERASLVLDQNRERLAAQRAIIESEIASIQARAARAALAADQARLQIQERTLQSELAQETNPEEQARLQAAIQQNRLGQQAGDNAISEASQSIAEQEQITELRRQDLANLEASQVQRREALVLEQQLAQFQLLQSEAADARARATETAAEGSRSLANTANRNAIALERQRDAAEQLASALVRAAQASQSIQGGPTAGLPGFRDGTSPSGAPGGLAVVGEAGPEIVNLPRGAQVFSQNRSKQMAMQAMQTNPEIAKHFLNSPALANITPNLTPLVSQHLISQNNISTASMERELSRQTTLLESLKDAEDKRALSERIRGGRGARR
ncbi:MAG: phage tail tape measure protein [Cyanobacteria bacterium P01_F01_bin.13]